MLSTALSVNDYFDWRTKARDLLQNRVPPDQVVWTSEADSQQLLFDSQAAASNNAAPSLVIPKSFLQLAETVSRHSNPHRWTILYRVAWRLLNGERYLLNLEIDDDVAALQSMRRAVEKDIYKMRAFVRFRKVEDGDAEQFLAWYQPEHRTLDANSKFFVDRFGSMRWGILTPESSMFWDLKTLQFGPGVPRSEAPADDQLEDLWRLYYRTIYNPARLNLSAMRAQLPVFRWIDLPEARTIPDLVRLSAGRVQHMAAQQPVSATAFIPQTRSLPELREAVRQCGACNHCRRANQAVFGEGNPEAQIVLVGEQPGDEEDKSARPFVGPAGQVLDKAIREAGLSRPDLYLTNAVKAFIFEERGKRRIHQTPKSRDIEACRPWLMAELDALRPKAIMCLGGSAAQSVLGRKVQITAERGRFLTQADTHVGVTFHPSAILRNPDAVAQERLMRELISDLASLKPFLTTRDSVRSTAAC